MSISREREDVAFTWKPPKSQFHATHKLKSVDFRSRKMKMLISCKPVTARMLISLGDQQKVSFTQRVNSKNVDFRSKEAKINIHFTLTRDSKDVEFIQKTVNVNFTQRISSKMMISGQKG